MSSLAEVVLISVHHHCPANDGVLPSQGDHCVSDVKLGSPSLSSDVTEVPGVPGSLPVLRCSVLALVRVEVRSGTGAAVCVVTELEILLLMSTGLTLRPRLLLCSYPAPPLTLLHLLLYLVDVESVQTISKSCDLPCDEDWAGALLLKVNSPRHLTGSLQHTHRLHHGQSIELGLKLSRQ